ncbi:hypothetical protein V2J09_011192 [Rumex salicifolius]
MSVPGYKYYLVIIDDFSHYVWCFSLKQKSDTALHLKQFHAYVQTQFHHKLKSIQCDHGREFDNNDLHYFFSANALHTATYLLNITPTTTLHMRTPHQVLFRQLPSYNHHRVFGCLCFPNLTATTAHKLEPSTRPCVFLWLCPAAPGYTSHSYHDRLRGLTPSLPF